MPNYQVKSPVVIFIYKRATNLEAITAVLRKVKPARVYIIADGSSQNNDKEVLSTRIKLESLITWKCKIIKIYSDTNLGLKKRFASGINTVFQKEDRAIFIEDDCIPSITFFRYCDELLEKYVNNPQIGIISGDNFLFGQPKIKESYYFSRYPLIWGWASWRRAWKGYDPEITTWKIGEVNSWLSDYLGSKVASLYWHLIFNNVKKNIIKTWDYQLTYHFFKSRMLHITPKVNMVTNVGIDSHATNTKIKSRGMGQTANDIEFPLIHPTSIVRNIAADTKVEKTVFITPIIATSLVLRSIFGKLIRKS